ncbi:hypothetical protein ONS95_002331 [Cadophora gregata]|uniref:uncharacterized protein n=1 Tax=Cadophora gregata TaxID=51156 RepID=UPI0026DB494D|nr:uncharacterized protein ONS95_002331 [Cadophora gregata]KAK0109650.1 hypothetical protein ONS95_002331 [Cadophora gregata]
MQSPPRAQNRIMHVRNLGIDSPINISNPLPEFRLLNTLLLLKSIPPTPTQQATTRFTPGDWKYQSNQAVLTRDVRGGEPYENLVGAPCDAEIGFAYHIYDVERQECCSLGHDEAQTWYRTIQRRAVGYQTI